MDSNYYSDFEGERLGGQVGEGEWGFGGGGWDWTVIFMVLQSRAIFGVIPVDQWVCALPKGEITKIIR